MLPRVREGLGGNQRTSPINLKCRLFTRLLFRGGPAPAASSTLATTFGLPYIHSYPQTYSCINMF